MVSPRLSYARSVASLASDVAAKADASAVAQGRAQTFHIDGYASVQAALTAAGTAGGGTVVGTPSTTYAQTTTLTIPAAVTLADVSLAFTGTPDSSTAAVRLDGAGATIEGCTVAITAGAYYRHIHHRASGTVARRNTLTASGLTQGTPTAGLLDFGFYSIFATMSPTVLTGIVIEDNDIAVAGVNYADGVQVKDCPGVLVRRNHIHDLDYTWTTHADKAHFWGIYVSAGCQGAKVEGNTVEDCDGGGIHLHAGTGNQASDYGRIVAANTIRNCAYTGIALDACNAPQVTGNHVSRCERLVQVGSADDGCWGGTVTGNTLDDLALVFGTPQLGADTTMIGVRDSRNVAISGNTFGKRGAAIYAIYASGTGSTGGAISGNTFGPSRPRFVVLLSADSDDTVIANNTIPASDDTTPGSAIIVYGDDCVIADNTIAATAASNWFGVRLYGSTNTVRGNRIKGGARAVIVSGGTGNIIDSNPCSGSTFAAIDNGGGTGTVIHHSEAGAPTVAAAVGSTWRRTDGGASTTLYVNETGTTTWRAV